MRGLFGIFGRSQEMQRLDFALRAVGLHPRLVSDAVKIATLKQLKDARGRIADAEDCTTAAELLAYCALGPKEFAAVNEVRQTEAVERRLLEAIATGHNLDARLVLLALHAGLAHPSVVERYDLAIG